MLMIDLCANGVSMTTTKYDDRQGTPQQWGEKVGVEAAINADFFEFPGWSWVIGRARGQGVDWPAGTQQKEVRPYWQFGPDFAQGVSDGAIVPAAGVTDIAGGHNLIIAAGKYTGPWSAADDGALLNTLHTRTGVGISADRRTLFMVVTSQAISCTTLVDWMFAGSKEIAGAPAIELATNQDGGGSSQMYVRGRGQIVSTGRQVGNHFGVHAKGGTGLPTNCVPKWAGAFVAQSYPGFETGAVKLVEGASVDGWIDMRNVGTSTWTKNTRLGLVPRDTKSSPVGGVGWLGPNRPSAVEKDTPPGSVGRFPLKLTGVVPGDHVLRLTLVEELVTWFADPTLGGGPPDDLLKVHVIVTPKPVTTPDAGPDSIAADATTAIDSGGDDSSSTNDSGALDSPPSDSSASGGCGCAAAGSDAGAQATSALAWLAFLGSLALRRRRSPS